MKFNIVCLPGDGIGPEVTKAMVQVLQAIGSRFDHEFNISEYLIGGAAIEQQGVAISQATLEACIEADAVFLGAIGGPRWDNPNAKIRPEQGLLQLRSAMQVFANIRPLNLYPALSFASPLKAEKLDGVDFVIVRELIGGLYFGSKIRGEDYAIDECRYSTAEIERICQVACEIAMQRQKKITSVDKANVLETSRLWRETVTRFVSENYPQIEILHQLVDSCAMQLIQQPSEFDVILTENLFGDILSDEASVLAGSMGLLASSSIGHLSNGRKTGLFEPIHGSAPDIAGRGIANPYASILSMAMMLRWLELIEEAECVERAVSKAIELKVLTSDLLEGSQYSTQDISLAVIELLS